MNGRVRSPSIPPRSTGSHRLSSLWVVVVCAAGTLLRLYVSLVVHSPGDELDSDMYAYDLVARHCREKILIPDDTFLPMGYPLILCLLYKAAALKFILIGSVQALLGGATCIFVHQIALRMSRSRRAALLATAIAAFYTPLILYSGLLLTEAVSPFFVALGIWLVLRAGQRGTLAAAALAGLGLGAAAAIRSDVAGVFLLLPFYFRAALGNWREASKYALKVAVFALPILLPLSIATSRTIGHPTFLSANGGMNFFLSFSQYKGVRYQSYYWVPLRNWYFQTSYYASPVPLYDQAFFYRQGWIEIVDHPSRLVVDGFWKLVEGLGLGRSGYFPVASGADLLEKREAIGEVAYLLYQSAQPFCSLFAPLVVLPIVLHSIALGARREILLPENAPRLLAAMCLLLVLATFYAFLADPRVHLPFEPLLIAAAVDASFGLSRLRMRRRTALG